MLDEAEHGIVLEAALARREAEQRLVAPVHRLLHRQRGERDQRQREVDREDGDRNPGDRAWDVSRRVARLLGEIRDRLDPGVRDHRDRDREEEVLPGGATPQWMFAEKTVCGSKMSAKPMITS